MTTLATRHFTRPSGARAVAYQDTVNGQPGWTVQGWSADGAHGVNTHAHTDEAYFRGRHWHDGEGREYPTLRAVMEATADRAQELQELSAAIAGTSITSPGAIARLTAGEVDVEIVPAGPGAIRLPLSDEPDWDSADASLDVGYIADHERHSIAELTIRTGPHSDDRPATDVSVELTPGDVDDLIAALQAVKARAAAR